MLLRYLGPHDAVEIPGVGTCERGGVLDVPREVAKSLAAQDTWATAEPATPPRRTRKRKES